MTLSVTDSLYPLSHSLSVIQCQVPTTTEKIWYNKYGYWQYSFILFCSVVVTVIVY